MSALDHSHDTVRDGRGNNLRTGKACFAATCTRYARDERIKLSAWLLNIVAAGFITTGTLGPLLTFLFSRLFDNTDPGPDRDGNRDLLVSRRKPRFDRQERIGSPR